MSPRPLHPTQLDQGKTLAMQLGHGKTPWFELAVEPTVDHTVTVRVTLDEDYADDWDGTLEMSAQDAVQIIEALSKALYTAMASREDADTVLIERQRDGITGVKQ